MTYKFPIGACVRKVQGHKFRGVVVARWIDPEGEEYVVRCTHPELMGCKMIFNAEQLERDEEK